MTNQLVGEVYKKIIEDVVDASANDFEESGVSTATHSELQQEWQAKLSQRGVAQMPWDPKPQPPQQTPAPSSLTAANGLPPPSYPGYDVPQANGNGSGRVKPESGAEQQYHGLSNGGFPQNGVAQGGIARARELVQEQYGPAASASLNAMQQRGGLALPGQQPKPQGLQLPTGGPPNPQQQQFQQQQQAAMARQQQQQQQLAQQQTQPRIKVENDSPQLPQGSFQQRPTPQQYGQTDGADEGLDQWRALLAERRAIGAAERQEADRMMHEQVMRMTENLQNGLMLPLKERPSRNGKARGTTLGRATAFASSSKLPSIPQLDGDLDDDEEKPDVKDEDDENAINSDLDDTDDEAGGPMGDDDDDLGDSILCTYDKVQRVKNKWKCTLKDGVMSVNGKEWVFHKGMGEFEW